MNIQQLRYVVAIANSGTFREAASKLFVNQPSLSVAIRDLGGELGLQVFTRTTTGTVLTSHGMIFYEKVLEAVKSFDSFEKQSSQAAADSDEFSITSRHYDFLPPLVTAFSQAHPEHKDFRIFESTAIQILDEIAQGDSEIGTIYLNNQNHKGLLRRMEKLGLEFVELIPFQAHIYLAKEHPLAKKDSLVMADLLGFPTVRLIQEKDEHLCYSENPMDTTDSSRIFNITDRATLNGILERTDAYATDFGFLDSRSINGITVIPLGDDLDNKMVYVKHRDKNLSACALKSITVMKDYFAKFSPKVAKWRH